MLFKLKTCLERLVIVLFHYYFLKLSFFHFMWFCEWKVVSSFSSFWISCYFFPVFFVTWSNFVQFEFQFNHACISLLVAFSSVIYRKVFSLKWLKNSLYHASESNSTFHSHDTGTKIYSLQATTPNYSNRVLLTTVCWFITNYLAKLKVSSS